MRDYSSVKSYTDRENMAITVNNIEEPTIKSNNSCNVIIEFINKLWNMDLRYSKE